MSQRTFFITLWASLIALGGVNHVALAQPAPDEAPKGANPPNWGNQAADILLNLRMQKPDGTPLARQVVSIMFYGARQGRGSIVTTDAQGRISISPDFQPNTYGIYVRADGIGAGYFKDIQVQNAGGPITDLRLQTGGTLRVNVLEALTNVNVDATVPRRALGGAQLYLQLLLPVPAPGNLGNQQNQEFNVPVYESTRDGDGNVELSNVLPGRYRLTVSGVPDYGSAMREFTMTEGAVVPLTMSLIRDAITSLKVTILDTQGHPFPNTDIKLRFSALDGLDMARRGISSTGFGIGLRKVHTDAKGEAILFPVRPGIWNVAAWGKIAIKTTEVEIPAEGGSVTLTANQG